MAPFCLDATEETVAETKTKDNIFDEFGRNTRLKPALLVILPLAGAVGSLGLKFSVAMAAVAGPLTAAGATFLLAQFARDFGLKQQDYLFKLWGGKPTTAKLRHRDGRVNTITLARYHAKAAALLGRSLPTAQEEQADPKAADAVYEAYGDLLRELTREKKDYPLVYEELIGYNFRRNLWGMKAIGVVIDAMSITIQVGFAVQALAGHGERLGTTEMSFLLVNVFLLGCWILITPDWVRVAADAYADRLLAASEKVQPVAAPTSERIPGRKEEQ
jgi:hypothetical protein